MAQIFPRWINKLPLVVVVAILVGGAGVVGFLWYYGSPWYTDVGYRPEQPVAYSHKLHAGELGIDCRYCHTTVEVSARANVPPTQTCMNCHSVVAVDSTSLLPVRESWASGQPIEWVRIHNIPDYAYFDHSVHVSRGVGCASCHGRVDEMEVVSQQKPLSMGWCLSCHRNPDEHLRPLHEVTNMKWKPGPDQAAFAEKMKKELKIEPPVDCSGCHR